MGSARSSGSIHWYWRQGLVAARSVLNGSALSGSAFLLLAVVAAVMLSPAISRAQEPAAFVTGMGDVPLMSGLQDVPDSAVIFDKPSGRLVEAYAEGEVKGPAVLRFYRETLPQLGWTVAPDNGDSGVFFRESERLEIHILEERGRRTVRFVLSPR